MLELSLIISTITAGYFGAPWWTALLGASGLALLSMAELRAYQSRLLSVGGNDVLSQARLANLGAHALPLLPRGPLDARSAGPCRG